MSAEITLGKERQAGKRVPRRFRRSPAIEGMAEPPSLYYRLPMHLKMLVAAVLLVGCSKSKSTTTSPPEERVYVSDEDGGNVVVISTSSDAVVTRIPVGKRPRGMRISPDGTRLFVA